MQLQQLKKKRVVAVYRYSNQHCVVAHWAANDPENTANYFNHTRSVKVTGVKKCGSNSWSNSLQLNMQQEKNLWPLPSPGEHEQHMGKKLKWD